MHTYWHIYKTSMMQELAYPTEVVAYLLRKIIWLGFLIIFWNVVSLSNSSIFDPRQMISYFFITSSIADLTFAGNGRFGRVLQKFISSGSISNVLIKPVNVKRYILTYHMGNRFTVTIFSAILLTFGIIIFPPQNTINVILFPLFLIPSALVGLAFNIILGVTGFFTPESNSLITIYERVSKILSGAFIPLQYFPDVFRQIVYFSPFPSLAFFPAWILQNGGLNLETARIFILGVTWSSVLLILANFIWKKSVKHYEGVGI